MAGYVGGPEHRADTDGGTILTLSRLSWLCFSRHLTSIILSESPQASFQERDT